MRKLHVFYNEKQSTDKNKSFSPSAGKPKLFIERIANHPNVNIVDGFPPIKKELLYHIHDQTHVDDVLSLKKENGFHNTIKAVTDTLLWTNASFLYASINAVKLNTCTCSPTNGFHHAEYDGSMAFCTFNGLMLSAKVLHDKGYAKRIGIVDLDAHYGNGTDDIIKKLNIDYVQHLPFWSMAKLPEHGDGFLPRLEKHLNNNFKDVDIILYHSGADPHVDDPLGGVLTTEQMKFRDEMVFRFAHKNSIPIAWCLGGGYQDPVEKVIDLHEQTLTACMEHYFDL